MNKVTNFEWAFNSGQVRWECGDAKILLTYPHRIRSAIVLDDQSGVAMVEPFEDKGRDNAVVCNADGSVRFRLKFPLSEQYGFCYDQIFYVQGLLTAFANLQGVDFGYQLDQNTGAVMRSYQSK
jgi:hypothetical protein